MDAVIGREIFIVAVILYAIGLSWAITRSVRRGRPVVTTLLALLAGPPPGLLVWAMLQKGQPDISKLTLGNISYAATFGDLFVLIPILVIGAISWRKYGGRVSEYWRSPEWFAIAMVVGFAIGLTFHFVLGGHDTTTGLQLHDSATSWLHNLGIVPVFSITILLAIVPLFTIDGGRKLAIIATAMLVVGWGGLVAFDMLRMQLDQASYWHFDPHWLDTVMDWSR